MDQGCQNKPGNDNTFVGPQGKWPVTLQGVVSLGKSQQTVIALVFGSVWAGLRPVT